MIQENLKIRTKSLGLNYSDLDWPNFIIGLQSTLNLDGI